MIVVNFIQTILYLILFPLCLGMFYFKGISKEYRTVGRIYVFGFMTELAVSEMAFLACYCLKTRFTPYCIVLSVLLFILSFVSLIVNRKNIKQIKLIKADYSLIVLVFFTVLLIVMRNIQGINDGDDAFVLGVALTTKTTDYFYTIDYYTGHFISNLSYLRHILSVNPIFIAFISKVTFIHPTILAHTVLGSLYLVMRSVILYDIAELLFDDEKSKKYRSIFSSLVLFITVFDFHSFETDSTFFLTRTWQGKAMFCGLLIPLVIEVMLLLGKTAKKGTVYYIILSVLCVSSVAMTPSALYMYTLPVGIYGLCLSIANKKIGILFKTILALLPMAFFAAVFLYLCR